MMATSIQLSSTTLQNLTSRDKFGLQICKVFCFKKTLEESLPLKISHKAEMLY